MRSIPEKTLEHWSSIYLANRFPNGSLWWPASGEDVLAELPRLAATGPGKTLALELKTTESVNGGHVLQIDTHQLQRYLHPPGGPPMPIYYVFPVPHWAGPLKSRQGRTPRASGGPAAPPEWWRRRVGWPWFGDWLYVMPAQVLGQVLPSNWRTRSRTDLFSLKRPQKVGTLPRWQNLFPQAPIHAPMHWTSFWAATTRCGPAEGVRWLTIPGRLNQPERVQVLSGDEQQIWSFSELLDQPWLEELRAPADVGSERVMVHIPQSALASPMPRPNYLW